MTLTSTLDGVVTEEQTLLTGEVTRLTASEVRRERTGLHATVSIWLQKTLLAYDTFNVGRSEERARLARRAFGMLGDVTKEAWGSAKLSHDLDIFCAVLGTEWENRFYLETFDDVMPAPVSFAVKPYIVENGGTIFFAPPGQGKSYTLQIIASCLPMTDKELPPQKRIWEVPTPRFALYVNLERSADSIKRRGAMIMHALGIPNKPSPVVWLNARGRSLKDVSGRVRSFIRQFPNTTVFIDSISRAGAGGSLVEDETANLIADQLNGLGASWAAIAHTPRADTNHAYGSVMLDAAEDIGVKVASERRGSTLGISLTVVKANDIATPAPFFYALEFAENPDRLTAIRASTASEFPELATGKPMSNFQKVKTFLDAQALATPSEISEATGIAVPHVSEVLHNSPNIFYLHHKEGRAAFYAIRPLS